MKKLVSLAVLAVVLFSCSKVKDGEFLITGTAKGMENGKKVILQTMAENGMSMISVDTVLVKDGKFEIKGKIKEPALHSLVFPDYNNGLSLIVENDEVKVEVLKDSIQNSKISGTYHNDEFQKFNQDIKKVRKSVDKKMADFQAKNMQAYQDANTKKDTVTVNKIIKEANTIQNEFTDAMAKYAEGNTKSFISLLIIDNMFKMPNQDMEKVKKMYNALDADLKNTKPGKKIKTQIDALAGAKKKL